MYYVAEYRPSGPKQKGGLVFGPAKTINHISLNKKIQKQHFYKPSMIKKSFFLASFLGVMVNP